MYSNCTGVYIYADPPDHYYYNMNQGLFETVIVSTPMMAEFVKSVENKDIRVVKNVIVDNKVTPEAIDKLKGFGMTVYHFEEIIEKGRKSEAKLERTNEDSDVYVVSTSGSTGYPKGAVLGGDAAFYNACFQAGPWHDMINEDSIMLNNITLGFATVLGFNNIVLAKSGRYVYIEKKCASFMEEIRIGDPTFLILSPLAYNKIYQGIMLGINRLPEDKKAGLLKAIDMKTKFYQATKKYKHPELDKVLEPFRKTLFGDRLKFLVNVGASINEEVLTFFRILTGAPFLNCYGSCEMGGICYTGGDTEAAELISNAVPWYEFKLVDIPDKGYLTTDQPYPRGELCVRGPIMRRYLNEPKKTTDTVCDGWLKTGDVAVLREGFKLQLIDRKNQVVKLTCAEFISLERVENLYKTSKYVAQLTVYADQTRDYAIGIVVPSPEVLLELAKEKGWPMDFKALCQMEEVEHVIVQDFKRIADEKRALYFEYLPRVVLIPELFTQANGLITVTFKVRRIEVAKRFEDRIEAVYKDKKAAWIH